MSLKLPSSPDLILSAHEKHPQFFFLGFFTDYIIYIYIYMDWTAGYMRLLLAESLRYWREGHLHSSIPL